MKRLSVILLSFVVAQAVQSQGTDIGSIQTWHLDHVIEQRDTGVRIEMFTDTIHEGWTAYVIRNRGYFRHAFVRCGDKCYYVIPMPLKGIMFSGHMETPCDQHTAVAALVRTLVEQRNATRRSGQ